MSVWLCYKAGSGGRRLSMSVGFAWGAESGGTDRLWVQSQSGFSGSFDPKARLNAEMGYVFDDRRGLLTPYAGFFLSQGADIWRAGAHWKSEPIIDVCLEASLTETASDETLKSGLLLRGSKRWYATPRPK